MSSSVDGFSPVLMLSRSSKLCVLNGLNMFSRITVFIPSSDSFPSYKQLENLNGEYVYHPYELLFVFRDGIELVELP